MSDEPELRRDPVTGRWVVIAPDRARRPIAFSDHAPRHLFEGPLLGPIPLAFVHQAGERETHFVGEVVEHNFSVIEIGKDSHPGEHKLLEDMGRFDGFTTQPRFIHDDEILKWRNAFESF